MRYIKLSICLIALLMVCQQSFAQDIEGGGNGETWVGKKTSAEEFYQNLAYFDAIKLYQKLLKDDASNPIFTEHLADCYRLTGQYKEAVKCYEIAYNLNPKGANVVKNYAQMLQVDGQYSKAINIYGQYQEILPESKLALNQKIACGMIPSFLETNDRFLVTNLKQVNTEGLDFSPTWTGEGIIFASTRDKGQPAGKIHSWLGASFSDMYNSNGEKITFEKPTLIRKDANTKFHDATATFLPDKKTVYFTRNNYINRDADYSKGDKILKQGIFFSDVKEGKWDNDRVFQYNNKEYDVAHPSISTDGKKLYFASNMPGGKGGMDLYVCESTGPNQWSAPKNIEALNTDGDEMFPYVDKNGFLFFASNGWGGIGGLDIFRSTNHGKEGTFTTPLNIGAPINSAYDDFGLVYGKDESAGYFTSNRLEGVGMDDIWSFEDKGVFLEGIVVDKLTDEPICKSTVQYLENKNKVAEDLTGCDGIFRDNVVVGKDYCFIADAKDYIKNSSVCQSTKNAKPGQTIFVKIPLEKAPASVNIQVLDKKTGKPIKSAEITLLDKCTNKKVVHQADENGQHCFEVTCKCEYVAFAEFASYKPGESVVNISDDCERLVVCGQPDGVTIPVYLEKAPEVVNVVDGLPDVPVNLTIELKSIYYDFDKDFIRKESEPQLQKVLQFLLENPTAVVEISSHTDARASFTYNIDLSQRRANSVVKWLINQGIPKERMKPVGYGETKVLNGCSDGVRCTEFEHQRNRRTEFRVIGGTINIKSLERLDMNVDPCTNCPF